MSRKVLVTGAAGFIGFHVARALKARGDTPVGIDNFYPYYDPALKKARVALLRSENITFFEGDLNDAPFLSSLYAKEGFTHVLHLAAQAGVRYALEHPDIYLKSNIDAFLAILELHRKYPHIPLVYASSSSVYGCNEKIPFSVEDPTDRPANLYAATKKSNELMAYSYHHLFGIPSVGLRYFTVYGPWGRPDMAYYSFAKNIVEGKPLTLFNEGKMQRDFTYIDDVVRGTLAALEKTADCSIYNIGNNHPEDLFTLISLLEKHLGKKALLQLLGPSKGEVTITYADIEKSKKELSFAPTITLEEGISRFIAWFKEYHA